MSEINIEEILDTVADDDVDISVENFKKEFSHFLIKTEKIYTKSSHSFFKDRGIENCTAIVYDGNKFNILKY